MYFSARLWSYTKGVRLRIALAVAFGLATAATGIARLALLGWLLARVFEGRSFESLVWPILGVAAITAGRATLQYFKEMVAYHTAARVQLVLRQRLNDRIVELGPAYFDNRRTGDVTITVVEGVEQLETFFGQYLPQFFTAVLTPLGLFAFMAFLDLPTAGIYLGFAMLTLLTPSVFHRMNARSSAQRRIAYGHFAADFLDSIQGLATLKAFGQSRARLEILEARAHEVFRSTMWVLASNAATHGITIAGIAIGAAVALAVGALRVNSGDMQLSVLLIVLMLGVEVFRPLRELSQLFHQGLLGISAASGLFDLMGARPIVTDAEQARYSVDGGSATIEFDDVAFSYPGGRRPALTGVSFKIQAGERVGVVGRSGAGKSTLMWLLQRLYDPQRGRVLVGGHDVRELTFDQLRGQTAVVAQDTYLFHGTVADNLRFGKPGATLAELEQAARAANAHDFIARLPQRYDTMIGERGVRLSGGQRQRIAIARALLRDAPILVLDEALSSVDAENEAVIQQALDRLMAGRTTLIMAHRLSSVIGADRILVLDDGALVESGPHADLLARNGAYTRLMKDQASDTPAPRAGDASAPPLPPEAVSELPLPPGEGWGEGPSSPSPPVGEGWGEGSSPTDRHDPPPPRPGDSETDAVQLAPTDAILRAESMGWLETFGRLLQLVAPQWPRLIGALLTGVSHFVGLIGVGVISALMVAAVRNGEPIGGLLLALFLIAPLVSVFTWLESWISHDMAFRLLSEMRVDLFRKLDMLAPGYLQRRRTGDLVAMATQDVETVEYFFAHTVANAFVAILVPGGVLITLLVFGWPLALALLPFLAAAALSPALTRTAVERLGSVAREKLGELNAHSVDTVQGLREIAAFQRGPERQREFTALMNDYLPVRIAFNRQIVLQRVFLELLIGLGALTILALGASLAAAGSLDPTRLPLLTLISMGSFLPIAELTLIGRRLGDTLGSTRRLAAVHSETVAVTDGPGVPVAQPRVSPPLPFREPFDGAQDRRAGVKGYHSLPGNPLSLDGEGGGEGEHLAHAERRKRGEAEPPAHAQLDAVAFSYDFTNHRALQDVTFDVPPGSTIAIVGHSGAGKTTTAHLMMRFWDPAAGRIRLGGHDLREYLLDQLRGRIALVAQDTYLFNASIRENLLVAKPDANDDELAEALQMAGLSEFVASIPDGLDTVVGERGMQLSGGQRQRVAIGRAVLKDSPFLLLDEATSHLDAVNERLVRDALGRLMADRTTLVIAHRLSTVRDADLIVVLHEGRVVETGVHSKLLARGGLYARLVSSQLATPARLS